MSRFVPLGRTDAFRSLAKEVRNWQLVAFLLVIANVVLAGGFARAALASRYVPYLVELDGQGNAVYAGPLEELDQPEERLIVHQLRNFLWSLRLVVDDSRAQQELVARAYALADLPLRKKLDRHFAEPENDPRAIAPVATRTVSSITFLRLPGAENTFQARWTETLHPRNGLGRSVARTYQGLLTYERADSLSPEALTYNPLGLIVTELTWTETTPED